MQLPYNIDSLIFLLPFPLIDSDSVILIRVSSRNFFVLEGKLRGEGGGA